MRHVRALLVLVLYAVVVAAMPTAGRQTPDVSSSLVDAPALLADLKALSADDMQGRLIGTPGGARARAMVVERFKAAGIQPFGSDYLQPFTAPGRRGVGAGPSGVNVVGRVDGTTQPARFIVVSAHYDHVGMKNGQVFNGADDNASGTAALFAIGAYFRAHPPASTLIFAAFDGEEAGLLGSRAFVRMPPVDRSALLIDVNVDMIGRDFANTLYVVGVSRQSWLRPYVERVARQAPVKLLMGHDTSGPGADDWTADSDHYSFLEAGIPAIYLGVEDNKQHHQPTDDYETMTYGFYVAAVETTIQMIRELDANADAIAAARKTAARN